MLKKKIFIFILFLSFFILTSKNNNVFSQQANCDLCGYCKNQPNNIPSNWKSCAQCLYDYLYEPNEVPDTPDGKTLDIQPETKQPPKPKKGRLYTFLGCINTNLQSFQEEGATVRAISAILNIIFRLVGALSFIYISYGGFILLTSQGNSEKIQQGKRIITRALIGLIISLGSILIIRLISQSLDLPIF